MKIRSLFLGMLACIGMAACSSEDTVDNTVGKDFKGTAYMKVNLVFPGQGGSRATGDSYADGETDENAVNDALFLFFKEDGTKADVQPIKLNFSVNGNGTADDNVYGTQTLELNFTKSVGVVTSADYPKKVVAILNWENTGIQESELEGKSLTEVCKLALTQYRGSSTNTNTNFVMTNSAYSTSADGNSVQYAAPIADGQIYTVKSASTTPVMIPVERVVAKVNVNNSAVSGNSFATPIVVKKDANDNLTISLYDVDDSANPTSIDAVSDVTVNATLTGYRVAYDASNSNLIKDITGINGYSDWNDANCFRSYWGVSRSDASYNKYQATPYNTTPLYCFENTTQRTGTGTKESDKNGNATTLVVTAELNLSKEGTTFKTYTQGSSIYKWAGNYYTEKALKVKLLQQTNTEVNNTNIDAITFPAMNDEPSKVTATCEAIQSALNDLTANAPIICWKNGETYYFTNIKTPKAGMSAVNTTSEDSKVGIIRNSVYNINIKKLIGMGTSIVTPGTPITPTDPEGKDASYLSATIQVLAWRAVSQDVNLGE